MLAQLQLGLRVFDGNPSAVDVDGHDVVRVHAAGLGHEPLDRHVARVAFRVADRGSVPPVPQAAAHALLDVIRLDVVHAVTGSSASAASASGWVAQADSKLPSTAQTTHVANP